MPHPSVDRPWWLVGVAVVLFAVGFSLEFTGTDGNSLPGSLIVVVGFVALLTFSIVVYRRLRAAH
jgi:hypothetical protein